VTAHPVPTETATHDRHPGDAEPHPDYDDARITAMGLFAEVFGGLNSKFAAQVGEHRLSPVEFEVLLRLARTPAQALRMTDLATQTMLTTSGITRVVDRLERDGLVSRFACPTDRRGLLTGITKAGLDRLHGVLPGHLDMIEQWFTGNLDAEELATFLATLRKLRDAVRPGAVAGARPTC
jgi:MarR family transcriptional regulator, 2-MHQ and catechol-resistance regulon repressor